MHNTNRIQKYWKFLIYMICIIMLTVPYSEVFIVKGEDAIGRWVSCFAFNTFQYSITVIPLVSILVFITRVQSNRVKNILIFCSCFLSGFLCLQIVLALIYPFQDIVPKWGSYLLLASFPLIVVNAYLEKGRQDQNNKPV